MAIHGHPWPSRKCITVFSQSCPRSFSRAAGARAAGGGAAGAHLSGEYLHDGWGGYNAAMLLWLAGRPVRQPRDPDAPQRAPRRPRYTPMVRALDNYRRRTARRLKWKPYMVFQRRVILAIDRQRPESLEDLARIPGLGDAKIARFGEELLDLIRQHSG